MHIQDWNPNFLTTTPIFEPLKKMGYHLKKLKRWPSLLDLAYLKTTTTIPIHTRSGKPVCFVPESKLSREFTQQYEPRIYLTGEVQTRTKNWHDLFNALVWVTYPRAKAVLNEIHYQSMRQERRNMAAQRGPLRDAATLFDESGIVVLSSNIKLVKLLKNHKWKELFWQQRETLMSSMKFFVFGHGLYEKALNPYLGMTAKGIIFEVDDTYFNQPPSTQLTTIDVMLERFLLQNLSTTVDLVPIPVLGYPDWSIDNTTHTYYDNINYFRPHPIQQNKL